MEKDNLTRLGNFRFELQYLLKKHKLPCRIGDLINPRFDLLGELNKLEEYYRGE